MKYFKNDPKYRYFWFFTFIAFINRRLRNGIEASPENWKDCEMFVQDVVRPNINITAEIPKEAVEQFQQICKLITN